MISDHSFSSSPSLFNKRKRSNLVFRGMESSPSSLFHFLAKILISPPELRTLSLFFSWQSVERDHDPCRSLSWFAKFPLYSLFCTLNLMCSDGPPPVLYFLYARKSPVPEKGSSICFSIIQTRCPRLFNSGSPSGSCHK